MPTKNDDLHGNAPDKSDVALLLIDVINDLEFPEGDQLLHGAVPMARQVLKADTWPSMELASRTWPASTVERIVIPWAERSERAIY